MYGKILVPVDGSDASNLGLKAAIKLAKQHRSQLRVLHVVSEAVLDYSYADIYSGTLVDALRRAGRDILHVAESTAKAAGLEPELRLVECIGKPAASAIVEHAKEWPADLIVLGTHGRRGIRRLALGSDAEQVLRTAPAPVLLVRGGSTDALSAAA